jgi:hypothetical protein
LPNPQISDVLSGVVSDKVGVVSDNVMPGQQASYRIVQSGTESASKCVNFRPLNNFAPMFKVSNIISSPTAINFSWDAMGINLERVTLIQHQGPGCTGTGLEVIPLSPMSAANMNGQKVMGLTKGVSYSFKLKTSDNSAPDVCFNARTTDGDPPFMMPHAQTTLRFSAGTNVMDGKSHKILLVGKIFQQTDKYSAQFDKTSTSSDLLSASGAGLMNQGLNLLAPMGCQFVMGSSQFTQISLTESNTVYDSVTNVARVQTDGLIVQCSGSGGGNQVDGNQDQGLDIDALGAVPGRAYSRLKKLKIGKDAFIMRQDLFTSKDCTGFPVSSNTEQGVFSLADVDVEGTIPVDITQKDLDGAIFTQEGVDIANKLPKQFGCGLTGWVKGTVRKLGDSKCGEVGNTYYQRLKVDGGRLYVCSSGQNKEDGSTSEMRTPSCDITEKMMYFTRQK